MCQQRSLNIRVHSACETRWGWSAVPPSDNISVGELEVRQHEHSVLVRGQPLALSSKEFDIVMMLAEHPGWVFSADQLAGYAEEGGCSPTR